MAEPCRRSRGAGRAHLDALAGLPDGNRNRAVVELRQQRGPGCGGCSTQSIDTYQPYGMYAICQDLPNRRLNAAAHASASSRRRRTSSVPKASLRPRSMTSASQLTSRRERSSITSGARKLWGSRRPNSGLRRHLVSSTPRPITVRPILWTAFSPTSRSARQSSPATLAEFSCLVGTMAQEIYASSPDIRDACGRSIFGHAATLEADIEAARRERGITGDWTAESLARHTQAVIQGGFVLAKAGNNPEFARETLDHLDRYIRHLFHVTEGGRSMSRNHECQMRLRADMPGAAGRPDPRIRVPVRQLPDRCGSARNACLARRTSSHPTARRPARNIARIVFGSCPARTTCANSGCPPMRAPAVSSRPAAIRRSSSR